MKPFFGPQSGLLVVTGSIACKPDRLVHQHQQGDFSNWFTLGNQSETNMELMSA